MKSASPTTSVLREHLTVEFTTASPNLLHQVSICKFDVFGLVLLRNVTFLDSLKTIDVGLNLFRVFQTVDLCAQSSVDGEWNEIQGVVLHANAGDPMMSAGWDINIWVWDSAFASLNITSNFEQVKRGINTLLRITIFSSSEQRL